MIIMSTFKPLSFPSSFLWKIENHKLELQVQEQVGELEGG